MSTAEEFSGSKACVEKSGAPCAAAAPQTGARGSDRSIPGAPATGAPAEQPVRRVRGYMFEGYFYDNS